MHSDFWPRCHRFFVLTTFTIFPVFPLRLGVLTSATVFPLPTFIFVFSLLLSWLGNGKSRCCKFSLFEGEAKNSCFSVVGY